MAEAVMHSKICSDIADLHFELTFLFFLFLERLYKLGMISRVTFSSLCNKHKHRLLDMNKCFEKQTIIRWHSHTFKKSHRIFLSKEFCNIIIRFYFQHIVMKKTSIKM